jgi:hypothetical protein
MGNRCVVVFSNADESSISCSTYLHWNGSMPSIYGFMQEMKRRGVRADQNYECARFVHIVGDFFDQDALSTLSLGVSNGPKSITAKAIDKIKEDLGDNGVYVIYRNEKTYDVDRVRRFRLNYNTEPETMQEMPEAEVKDMWEYAKTHESNVGENSFAESFKKITVGKKIEGQPDVPSNAAKNTFE